MGHHTAILIFGILSFMGWYGCFFTTKRLIQQGGLHEKFWPKRYIMPNRKIRSLYWSEKERNTKMVLLSICSVFCIYCIICNKSFVVFIIR